MQWMLRKRRGRLLNVSSAFNLRLVSRVMGLDFFNTE